MYFYSLSSRGFYCIDITGDNMPDDAISITDDQRIYLQDGLSSGKVIVSDGKGGLALDDPLPYKPSNEEISISRRRAYSDPVTGSDRFFAEASRMQAMEVDGYEKVLASGIARFKEIQESFPFG